jgi:hypothetical protein
MKTKTTLPVNFQNKKLTGTRNALGIIALTVLGLSANAQNSSYSADALPLPTTGGNNAVFGDNSMLLSTTAAYNTAIGWSALSNITSGFGNTAGGYAALIGTNGNLNAAFGLKCMDSDQGDQNVGFGAYALNMNNFGSNDGGFGFNANVSANNLTNATAIGANAVVNANDRIWLGDINTSVWTSNYYTVSDGRFKKNVDADQVKGLDFIKLLRPVVYNFDGKGFTDYVTKNMSDDARKRYAGKDYSKQNNVIQSGFIAQEVEQAAKTAGYAFSGVHAPEGETDTYGISYYQFVVPLVKAVQEQQQMIDAQKAINQQLLQQVADQQKSIDALTAMSKASDATGLNTQSNINSFSMQQNEPNPFTHETIVKYNLPEQTNNAYMAVYDLSGKQIASFPLTQKGNSSLTITSEKLSPGIYIYSIVTDGKVFDSKRMIVADK